jgi:hypothetical protein
VYFLLSCLWLKGATVYLRALLICEGKPETTQHTLLNRRSHQANSTRYLYTRYLFLPLQTRVFRTLPDNHYADTLLLCVPTVCSSESRHNLCILFEQFNSSAYASRLEFQFLSVRHTKTRSSRSAILCFKLTFFGIQQHQGKGPATVGNVRVRALRTVINGNHGGKVAKARDAANSSF